MQKESIKEFIEFANNLKGDEKGEAQLFIDRLFRAFGHGGIIEANGSLETRIKFSTGKTKFADCIWLPPKRPGVLIEMKKKGEKYLETHFPQARDYWIEMNPETIMGEGAQKPEFIILCNFEKFIIYRYLSPVDEIYLQDLPDRLTAFNFLLPNNSEPIFRNNVEEISEEAAKLIGTIFKYQVYELGQDRQKVQRFLLQCVLALFSEDFGLLPNGFFSNLIRDCLKGESSFDLFGSLFRQMASSKQAPAGRFKDIEYFNGGLFEIVDPLDLDQKSLEILKEASEKKWQNVNPVIFGSLFESTLTSTERHTFGAHFTREPDILKIVNPTIIKPWKAKIDKAKTLGDLTILLEELSNFKVLDPSCGCGNFLYVAFKVLKDIEFMIIEKIALNFKTTKHLSLGSSKVSIKQFYGIDIQPIAVEVAKMTMMLGKEILSAEWNKRIEPYDSLGLILDQGLPLDTLNKNIYCADAILESWPPADVIIGNPPYQSKNKMKMEMDHEYVNLIREKYPDIPGRADYCVYWFRKAHDHLKERKYAGLVGTNTIRQNDSRIGGLDYILNNGGTIVDAVSTQVWSGEAIVYVSIVSWIKGNYDEEKTLSIQIGDNIDSPFEYHHPKTINSSLSMEFDVGNAMSLKVNKNSQACYQGQTHGHTGFLLKKDLAEKLLKKDKNNSKVLFPYLIGNDLLKEKNSLPKRYVIDFSKYSVFEAQQFKELYNQIETTVFPVRKNKAKDEETKNKKILDKSPNAKVNHHHKNFLNSWWHLGYPREELMNRLQMASRYIVCSRVTKRPIFEFVDKNIHPNDALQVFPLPDDYSFGILSSNIHWVWFKARCSTLKGDWRYTSDTVFDSFPWPQNPSLKMVEDIATIAHDFYKERRRIMDEQNLSLRDLYRILEKSPNNEISKIQTKLDEAVRNAYGMKKKNNILEFLLKLNHALYQKENSGEFIQGPGLPLNIEDPKKYISKDSIKMAVI